MMEVFLAVGDYGDLRDEIATATTKHWITLGAHLFADVCGPDQRGRIRDAADRAQGQVYCIADDDCLLKPQAFRLAFKNDLENWDTHVQRIFDANPQLGMCAAIPSPEFPGVINWGGYNFVLQELPENQWELWDQPTETTGNKSVGGIRFIRKGVLDGELPAGDDFDYDHHLCAWIKEQGWTVGYLPVLPCHHLGHGLSVVKKDVDYIQELATGFRPKE